MLLNGLGPVPCLMHIAGEEEEKILHIAKTFVSSLSFSHSLLDSLPFPRLDDAVPPPAPPALLSLASLQQEASITLYREGPALTFPGEGPALTFSKEGQLVTFLKRLAHNQEEKPDKDDTKPSICRGHWLSAYWWNSLHWQGQHYWERSHMSDVVCQHST